MASMLGAFNLAPVTTECPVSYDAHACMHMVQRQFSRKKRKSRNREKARIKLARLHEKVSNQRNDFLHKFSRKIAFSYSTIFVEDLQIPNMLQNHKLAKSIADASWGRFIQMLSYKAEEAGGKVVKVDPKDTTQICSRCGLKVPKTLSERIHICPRCELTMDRDLNASRNILLKNTVGTAGIHACGNRTSTPVKEQVWLLKQEASQLVER